MFTKAANYRKLIPVFCFFQFWQDVIRVHFALLRAIEMNMVTGGCGLGKIFLEFKERSVSLSISCFPGFNLVAKPRQSKVD